MFITIIFKLEIFILFNHRYNRLFLRLNKAKFSDKDLYKFAAINLIYYVGLPTVLVLLYSIASDYKVGRGTHDSTLIFQASFGYFLYIPSSMYNIMNSFAAMQIMYYIGTLIVLV